MYPYIYDSIYDYIDDYDDDYDDDDNDDDDDDDDDDDEPKRVEGGERDYKVSGAGTEGWGRRGGTIKFPVRDPRAAPH